MARIIYILIVAAAVICVILLGRGLLKKRLDRAQWIVAGVLMLCSVFISLSVADAVQPKRTLTLTALGQKAPASQSAELSLSSIRRDSRVADMPAPIAGSWSPYQGELRWFIPGDQRRAPEQTDSITFALSPLDQTELIFSGNEWKGLVELDVDGEKSIVDTYLPENGSVSYQLPALPAEAVMQALAVTAGSFSLCLAALCLLFVLLLFAAGWLWKALLPVLERQPLFKKLLSYQFLFEELVSRDFKKKYKRTVLGVAWSLLSPLLTLLVMRLVFTQFFGQGLAHYTIYLFCGNLVFSYFNESTSQGMTSLVGNAGIFTKVNVPKYLFLFSKNIQTLINFGLTLIVFFIFCFLDNITFTWKFVLLLYPITMLLLFNLGVGLILSAMFVFFKDIQYLWSVFTMLLMYMSAIFYNIDSYSPTVQNIFLINPVYLFIRYFRKIVIDATIPSPWFHLLMLADVIVVVGLGAWIYRRNNTKFLYYV